MAKETMLAKLEEDFGQKPFDCAEFMGLTTATELNGSWGVLKDFDMGKMRWQVVLPDGGAVKNVRPCNLHVFARADGDEDAADEEAGCAGEGGDEEERAHDDALNDGPSEDAPADESEGPDAKRVRFDV